MSERVSGETLAHLASMHGARVGAGVALLLLPLACGQIAESPAIPDAGTHSAGDASGSRDADGSHSATPPHDASSPHEAATPHADSSGDGVPAPSADAWVSLSDAGDAATPRDATVSPSDAPMRSGEGGDAGADALPLLDASATGLDAGMDCGELEDAGGEAAATDATAGDAAGAECNDTGEPTGTRTTLLTLSDAGSESLADFDVDCSGLVAATTDGRILTCPPAGCTGAPVTISGSIPPLPASSSNYYSNAYRVRIGLRGIVFAESNVNGNSESDVYTLHRDGSGVVLLHQLEGTGNPTGLFNSGCQSTIVLGDLSVANGDVFSAQTCYIGAGWTFLTAVIPRGGTCVPATNVVTLFMEAGDSIPPYPVAGALVGADYYGVTGGYGEPFWVVYANAFTQGVSPWASEPAFVGFKAIAASTTLVAVSSLPLGDGGADKGAVAVCAPGPKCAQPVWVSGIPSVATRLYADATTLYLTDASNDLYACDAALALAGSCVPKTLASPAPGFNEFRSDADNVYLLTNNSVVRIAK